MVSGRRQVPKNDPRECGFGTPGGSNFICTNPKKCGNQRPTINCNFCGKQGLLGEMAGMGVDERPSGRSKGKPLL